METDTALVWTDSTAALNTESSVYMDLSFVVKPWNTEDDDSLWLYDSFKDLEVHKVRMFCNVWCNAFKNFLYRLMKFLFSGISGDEVCHETVNVILCKLVHICVYLLGFKIRTSLQICEYSALNPSNGLELYRKSENHFLGHWV